MTRIAFCVSRFVEHNHTYMTLTFFHVEPVDYTALAKKYPEEAALYLKRAAHCPKGRTWRRARGLPSFAAQVSLTFRESFDSWSMPQITRTEINANTMRMLRKIQGNDYAEDIVNALKAFPVEFNDQADAYVPAQGDIRSKSEREHDERHEEIMRQEANAA